MDSFYSALASELFGTKQKLNRLNNNAADLSIRILENKEFASLDKYKRCQSLISILIYLQEIKDQ